MNIFYRNTPSRHGRQAGISLLVVLILLVVTSILGIAVLRSSAMQERMSANMYDRSLAMQATESALITARAALDAQTKWKTTVPVAADCTASTGLRVCPTFTPTPANTSTSWNTGPTLGGGATGVPSTDTQYWIEYLGLNQTVRETGGVIPASETNTLGPMFRITARSQSTGRASVTLQTDVIYRFPRL
jgi:type IV pilus assembly protein PilX